MAEPKSFKALNVLTKWRVWFAGWQLGTRDKQDPEAAAVRDQREMLLCLRVELNCFTKLCLDKGLFTADEWDEGLAAEAKQYCADLSERFPGVYATDNGLTLTHEAANTMRRMNFKP